MHQYFQDERRDKGQKIHSLAIRRGGSWERLVGHRRTIGNRTRGVIEIEWPNQMAPVFPWYNPQKCEPRDLLPALSHISYKKTHLLVEVSILSPPTL